MLTASSNMLVATNGLDTFHALISLLKLNALNIEIKLKEFCGLHRVKFVDAINLTGICEHCVKSFGVTHIPLPILVRSRVVAP